MIRLADIARRYHASLLQHYSDKLRPNHHRTLQHIIDRHTPACGMRYGFCKQCNAMAGSLYCLLFSLASLQNFVTLSNDHIGSAFIS